jgi:hypothetical protein
MEPAIQMDLGLDFCQSAPWEQGAGAVKRLSNGNLADLTTELLQDIVMASIHANDELFCPLVIDGQDKSAFHQVMLKQRTGLGGMLGNGRIAVMGWCRLL